MQLFLTRPIHWRGHRLVDPVLEQAHHVLLNPDGDHIYPERDRAFLTLLRSGHTPAVAIALDHFQHAEALTRHGPSSPYEAHADEVRDRARDLLRQPAFPAGPAADVAEGASHASALYALMNAAEPQDADLIAGALERSDEPNTRESGLVAARQALEGANPPSRRLLDVLATLVWDEAADEDDRCGALDAIGHADGPEALDIVVRAAGRPNLRLQVRAGLLLAYRHLDTHRDLVRRLVDSWPDDGDFLADQVRERLGDQPGPRPGGTARTGQGGGRGEGARKLLLRTARRLGDDDDVEEPGSRRREGATLAALRLGLIAKDERNLPEATRWFWRVIDSGRPEDMRPWAVAHLAELHYWLGDKAEAGTYYQRVLDMTDEAVLVAEAAFRLGEHLAETGDPARAMDLMETALATGDPAFTSQATDLLARLRGRP